MRLAILLLAALFVARPVAAQQSATASIPNVMVAAGNLLRDCRPEIDMAAARGFTALQTQFATDHVYGDWGYHYVLDFKEFPEARVFPPEVIARNREQMRANLAYAKEKGVKIFLHHYNFCAPKPFVLAHPEVNRRLKPTVMDEKTGHLYGDLCWNQPIYRRFLESCWNELFATYPELGGLVVTFGECNNCPDEARGNAFITAAHSFFTAYNQTLRRHGKLPVARTWWMRRHHVKSRAGKTEAAHTFLPHGPVYLMKFSLYDSVTEEPDTEFDEWRANGCDLWADIMSRGENVGPFYYINPRFQHARIASLVKRKVSGLKVIANDYPNRNYPLLQINQTALLRYAQKFEPYDEQDWVREFAKVVGDAEAATVLKACEDTSAVILGLPRVMGLPDEGFNIMGFYYFPPFSGWPGTLGADNMNPTPEWCQGLTPFRDIILRCVADGYTDGLVERVAAGRPTPFETLQGYIDRCERGIRSLEGSHARLLAAGKKQEAGQVEQLLLRARASATWGRHWNEMLRARLQYEGALRAGTEAERARCVEALTSHYDTGTKLLEEVTQVIRDWGNIRDALRLRREHRARILETAQAAVKNPPKRPEPIPVGVPLLKNTAFEEDADGDGIPDGWKFIPYAGKATAAGAKGYRGKGVAIASSDPEARGALAQLPEGKFGEGTYRLRVRYRLEGVESAEYGARLRLIARDEGRRDRIQDHIDLGKGTSKGWQVLEKELTFPPDACSLEIDLFLWLATGRVVFDDVTLERVR